MSLKHFSSTADELGMSAANQHVFSHGMRDTRETFELWNERPWAVLRVWLLLSLAIALALLTSVWFVAGMLTPDLTPVHLAGLTSSPEPGDLLPILWRNLTVLALHATACVAGFIAGASMPIAAAQRTGISRWIHVKAGELAILFVCAVTLFSLLTQSLYLGFQGSTLAFQLDVTRLELILSVLPHALPELTALFLPLAAWLIASRRGEWNQLLAATFITAGMAIPTLIVAATVEVYVWPRVLEAISPVF
jgi:Stage II sporulation protein M